MKNNRLQCKDIPDIPILIFLFYRKLNNLTWACWYGEMENSIGWAMPLGTPDKIKIKKMARLIQRGLIDGCSCGCSGDYEITDKGIEYLKYLLNK